jgi:predicted AAA+ superfamily ATPase
LKEALADTPVVLIHGPRQSGKTTLARGFGEPLGYSYYTFDDPALVHAAESDPIGFVDELPDRAILNEVQRVPVVLFTGKRWMKRADSMACRSWLKGLFAHVRKGTWMIWTGMSTFMDPRIAADGNYGSMNEAPPVIYLIRGSLRVQQIAQHV